MEALRAVGRAALAAMFVTGGADALLDPGPRAPRAAELGLPLEPELAVRLNGAGRRRRLGPRTVAWLAASALAGSLVATTLAGYPSWRMDDPSATPAADPLLQETSACSARLLVLAEPPARRR